MTGHRTNQSMSDVHAPCLGHVFTRFYHEDGQNNGHLANMAWAALIETTNTYLIILLALFATLAFKYFRSSPKLPPGPPVLPIVGSIPFLGSDLRASLFDLSKKYGDVYRIQIGSMLVVVLNGYDTIREALVHNGDVFSGRPWTVLGEYMTQGKGVVTSEGKGWKEHRRFYHLAFKRFGLVKEAYRDKINEEIRFCIDRLDSISDKAIDICDTLTITMANIIFQFIIGKRFDYDDPTILKIVHNLVDLSDLAGGIAPLTAFPWLKYLPGDPFKCERLREIEQDFRNEYNEWVREHKEQFDENNTRDFIDEYFKEMKKQTNKPDTTIREDWLLPSVGELFGAGTDTPSLTLYWAIAFMVRYPRVQTRVQSEIDDIIGTTRLPKYEDATHMPYTLATIAEIQRRADIVSFSLPRRTLYETDFKGFQIPAGTTIIPNLHSVHFNENYWENPEDFDPARFLDSDGKFHKSEKLIPFSIGFVEIRKTTTDFLLAGNRACLGETLAKMELFLIFSALLQRFTFCPAEGKVPSLQGTLGFNYRIMPYKVQIAKRHT